MARGDLLEMVGKVGRAVGAVQLLEYAQTLSSVCLQMRRRTSDPAVMRLRGSSATFSAKPISPVLRNRSRHRVRAAHRRNGSCAAWHDRWRACMPPCQSRVGFCYLCELIKGEERVAVCQRHPLERVVGGAPATNVPGETATTPHRAADLYEGRSCRCSTVPEVEAPAFHLHQVE